MSESMIRENLNNLENIINQYPNEFALIKKVELAKEIYKLLEGFQKVTSTMIEDQKIRERINNILASSSTILTETYGQVSQEMEMIESIKFLMKKTEKKDFSKDLELRYRFKELKMELLSKVRTSNNQYIKRDLFQVLNEVSRIHLYDDLNKNMTLSVEEFEKLDYLKSELKKDIEEIIDTLYFEQDMSFKMIIDAKQNGLVNMSLSECISSLNSIDSLGRENFYQISMNDAELNLVKNKLKRVTKLKIAQLIRNLPENINQIINHVKKAIEKEGYNELLQHSLIVDKLTLDSFSGEKLTDVELEQLKEVLKYLFKEALEKVHQNKDTEFKKEERPQFNEQERTKAIEIFKMQWLKAHQNMNEEAQKSHLEYLNALTEKSIQNVTLSEMELLNLKESLLNATRSPKKEETYNLEFNNLLLAEEININKMSLDEKQAELIRISKMNPEIIQNKMNLTEVEAVEYIQKWKELLHKKIQNDQLDIYLETKLQNGMDLSNLSMSDVELNSFGFSEEDIEKAKKRIEQKRKEANSIELEMKSAFPIGQKISYKKMVIPKFSFGKKAEKEAKVNGQVNGYILTNNIERRKFTSQEAAFEFLKENQNYHLDAYLIGEAEEVKHYLVEAKANLLNEIKNQIVGERKNKMRHKILNKKKSSINLFEKLKENKLFKYLKNKKIENQTEAIENQMQKDLAKSIDQFMNQEPINNVMTELDAANSFGQMIHNKDNGVNFVVEGIKFQKAEQSEIAFTKEEAINLIKEGYHVYFMIGHELDSNIVVSATLNEAELMKSLDEPTKSRV